MIRKTRINADKAVKVVSVVLWILTPAAIAGAIYVNVHWWIDWTSFMIAVGAFLAFLAVSAIPSAATTVLENKGWDGGWPGVMFAEAIITACLSAPLWYYHALTPNHTGFWSWIMLSVGICVPLAITGIVYYFSSTACKKDQTIDKKKKEASASEFDAMCDKWQKYVLGDGVQKFKNDVAIFLKEINLHFAQKCNMRQISFMKVNWKIVDDFIDQNDREALSQTPKPSYANINTDFCVDGEIVHAAFNLHQPGTSTLSWNHAKPAERFESWNALIAAIDQKL